MLFNEGDFTEVLGDFSELLGDFSELLPGDDPKLLGGGCGLLVG